MITYLKVKDNKGTLFSSFRNAENIPLYSETFFSSIQFSEHLKDKGRCIKITLANPLEYMAEKTKFYLQTIPNKI